MAPRKWDADVIVCGGGPAGSTLAWNLARRGLDVLVLERARVPREKVCGDYVHPRALRILEQMGCLDELERDPRIAITHCSWFIQGERCYEDEISFHGGGDTLSPYGYIIPRDELDHAMLVAAGKEGASVQEGTLVTSVDCGSAGVGVHATRGGKHIRYRAPLVVGADGANSIVGRSAGVLVDDPVYTAVLQRAYATGVEARPDEAAFFFDHELFPGFGWMLPLAGGRANVGVGILSEVRSRWDISVPRLFDEFLERLRLWCPGCETLELSSRPQGWITRTYGGAGPNYFDGGVLIGDAGSFVDPITGEGIAPAAESALLAAPVLAAALDAQRFDAGQLAPYETAFRAYFDPGWTFLDLCQCLVRNRTLAGPWLKALAHACRLAQADRTFAQGAGGFFGGFDVRPFDILMHIWRRFGSDLLLAGTAAPSLSELIDWQAASFRSLAADPSWHTGWLMQVQRKSLSLLSTLDPTAADPRAEGLLDLQAS
jgi:geranylgeranyl reductase family protein